MLPWGDSTNCSKNPSGEPNTMLAVFGIGFFELIILAAIGLVVVVPIGVVVVLIAFANHRDRPRD